MKSVLNVAACLAIGVALSACQTTKMAENAAVLNVEFSWENTKSCSPVSPAFNVTNVPEGTATLSFRMVDLNLPSYPHGGGKVAYTGSSDIPEGAFGYKGPCPPSPHNYKWTVQALNKAGDMILGQGTTAKIFPPS